MNSQADPKLYISAIITAYNSAAYICDAIQSVLDQTRAVDEIIVIDDGSTDETAHLVQRYADQGVRYVYQQNSGPSGARNRGFAEAKGQLLAFLDGDDLWLPEKIAKQEIYLCDHPQIGLVTGGKWWWDNSNNQRWFGKINANPKTNIRRQLVIENIVGNPSMVLMRRSLVERVGLFNAGIRWGEDWDYWIRCSEQGLIGFIYEPLIVYRWHNAGLMHQNDWKRMSVVYEVSRQAALRYQPLWQRPFLLAHAYSIFEFQRALHAVQHNFPRMQQVRHAGAALFAYPFANIGEKTKLFIRALAPALYRLLSFKKSSASSGV